MRQQAGGLLSVNDMYLMLQWCSEPACQNTWRAKSCLCCSSSAHPRLRCRIQHSDDYDNYTH